MSTDLLQGKGVPLAVTIKSKLTGSTEAHGKQEAEGSIIFLGFIVENVVANFGLVI